MKYVWPKFRCPIFCTRFVEKILRMNFEELGIDEPYDIRVINHLGGKFETGPFQIENFHVSHSVPEAQMLIINSPQGKVLHTGDWTFNDGNPIEPMTDYARLKEIGSDPDLLACVCDSTEISRQPVQTTELEVQETLVKIFNEAPERVLLTTYSRSIARMKMLAEAAKRTGRVAAVKGRSLETFRQVAIDLGYIEEDDLMLYDDIKGLPMKQQVVMVTGSQGEKYAMLTRLCRGEVREMKLQQTDTVLFSAIIIPGNEKEVSQMYNKLAQIGAHVKTIFDTENLHANGHAGMPEFRRFYEMVHPFIAIPMHGEFVSEMLNAKMAVEVGGAKHMIVVKNGEMVALKRGSAPFITEHLHVGTIVLEGTHEYAGNDPVFATRKKIMLNGAVFITMPVDKKGFLKGVPEVSSAGIFESDPSSLMKRNIQIQITKAVDALDKNTRRNSKAFEQTVRQAVNGALRPIIGKQKKPNIIVHYVYK
jgi:ribonuclease J